MSQQWTKYISIADYIARGEPLFQDIEDSMGLLEFVAPADTFILHILWLGGTTETYGPFNVQELDRAVKFLKTKGNTM